MYCGYTYYVCMVVSECAIQECSLCTVVIHTMSAW